MKNINTKPMAGKPDNLANFKALQKKETAKRIRQAISYLKQKKGNTFKTKTELANALASHAGVSVSLILRSTSPHAQLFNEAITLLTESCVFSKEARSIPTEALLAKVAELENKVTAYERIIQDLSKRVTTSKQNTTTGTDKRDFELTCRLVLMILKSNPTLQFDGSNLLDYGSLTGTPEIIATTDETSYYLTWQANVQH